MTQEQTRRVYRHAELKRLFDPASIAIVGASPNAASFGGRTLVNLAGYRGRIHLVNSKYREIDGRPCHASLSAIGEAPDCVVIAVPRDAALPVVEESIAVRAGGVILYASGFAESAKPEYEELQRRMVSITAGTGTFLLGPNVWGAVNALSGLHATFANVPAKMHRPGAKSIGLISQSGALGNGLVQAYERGVSFSHVLTSGNGCDVDVADQVAFLAEDPGCDVIACVFEGIGNPERLLEAGEVARKARKPVVVFKLATGQSGAEAALSHTGALAGSAAGYEALFERAGFVSVPEFESLLEVACFFAKAPASLAAGVAVLTPSGGAGILAADQAELHGVPLPQPGPELKALLQTHIPEFGAARNPCDVTAQILTHPASFTACADAFLAQPDIGAIAVPNSYAWGTASARTLALGELAHGHGKMVCMYWLSGWLEGPGAVEIESSPHVALFRSTSNCFRSLNAWQKWRSGLDDSALAVAALTQEEARTDVRRQLLAIPSGATLTESSSKRILSGYGVPVVGEKLVHDRKEAVQAASDFGFPVALKVASADLPHKTEAGVIRLGLKDAEAVEKAYDAVLGNALKVTSAQRIQGVLVQPMVPNGIEVLVGGRVDPLFGPLVVAGMGGVMVELLKDTVVALAPVSIQQAQGMIARLRGRALLAGFRGSEPVDLHRLAEMIARVSELISDQREHILEIDVNPLICSGSRIVAVDGLIVRTADRAQDPASS